MAFNEASSFIDLKAQVRAMVARRTAILESSASLRAELEELKEMEAKRRVEYKRALQNNLVQQALIGENNTSRASTKKLAGIAREGDSCNDKGEVLSETLHANGGFDALFIEFNAKLELQILNANMKANLSSLEKILNESTANTWQLEKEIKSAIEFPDKIKSVYICDLADLDVALRKESDNKAKLKESMMETINRLKEERVKLSKEANLIRKEICDILDDREFLYRSKVTTLKAVSIEESRYKFLVSEFIRVRQEIDELAFNPNPSQTADDNRGDSGYDWIDVAFEDLLASSSTDFIPRSDIKTVVESWFPPNITDDVNLDSLIDDLSRGYDIESGSRRKAAEKTRSEPEMFQTGLNSKEIKLLFNYLAKIN